MHWLTRFVGRKRAGKFKHAGICSHDPVSHLKSHRVQLEVGLPAAVEGGHEGGVDVGVGEAERVAELVGGRLQEVGALEGVDGPVLLRKDVMGFGGNFKIQTMPKMSLKLRELVRVKFCKSQHAM